MGAPKMFPCRTCRRGFVRWNSLQVTCSPACAITYIRKFNERTKAKQLKLARKAKREFRERTKTLSQLTKEAQYEFNKWIRTRDKGQPCISCGRANPVKQNAGHYRSTGAAPHLRFNEKNCHLQCEHCNSWLSGNLASYRPALIARIGAAEVEALEIDNSVKRWTRDELLSIKAKYRRMARELDANR